MERYKWIDIVKGIGIFLVVLGHMPSMPNFLHLWIFSFHMPLFFFLSGFLFTPRSLKEHLKRKTKSLIFPYIIYSVLFIMIDFYIYNNVSLIQLSIEKFLFGQGGFDILWFFVSLFIVEIIFNFIVVKTNKNKYLLVFSIVIIGYIMSILKIGEMFKIVPSLVSLGFFALGYYFKEKNIILKKGDLLTIIFLLIINVLSIKLNMYFGANNLDINSNKFGIIIFTYFAAFTGIILIINIAEYIKLLRISIILEYIGKYSMFFFPLISYIPVRIYDYFKSINQLDINNLQLKILSKIIGLGVIILIIELIKTFKSFNYSSNEKFFLKKKIKKDKYYE